MSIGIRTIYRQAADQVVTAVTQVTSFPSAIQVKAGQSCLIKLNVRCVCDGANAISIDCAPSSGTIDGNSCLAATLMGGGAALITAFSDTNAFTGFIGSYAANTNLSVVLCFKALTDCTVPVKLGQAGTSTTINIGSTCEVTIF